MKKLRILSLLFALALTVSLFSACGGSGGESQTGGEEESRSLPTVEATEGSIRVGLLAPLTGEVAQYGIAVRDGAMLYIDQVNEAGGINGKKIDVKIYDEEGDPAKAITGYHYLLDESVTAIIGDVTTAPTLAVVPETQDDNMPMITASATAAAVTVNEETGELYSNIFRSCFIDPFQGEKMAGFIKDHMEVSTVAVLFNTGSDYSVGLKDSFIAKSEELGFEVVAVEAYSDGAVDFQGQLTNIAAKKPDVLFLPDYYNTIALVAQQAQSAGVEAALIGVDGWDTVMGVVSDPALLEGAYYCSGYSAQDTTEAVQKFLSDYKAKYNVEPNMFAAQGYDAAMILVAALEKAENAGLEAGSEEYKQAVIDAMKATDMECITGHVTYNEFNNPEKTAVIIQIENGEAKFWGKY